ncbi:hypothetical protein PM082_002369 [Marasmius tenuissimus]|nr:hypothetical protein PM082_002369 [Marasmius tenuissimus]
MQAAIYYAWADKSSTFPASWRSESIQKGEKVSQDEDRITAFAQETSIRTSIFIEDPGGSPLLRRWMEYQATETEGSQNQRSPSPLD